MAPGKEKFSIYVDETQQINVNSAPPVVNPLQPQTNQNFNHPIVLNQKLPSQHEPLAAKPDQQIKKGSPARFKPDTLKSNERYYFDLDQIYPVGCERSFEELRLKRWVEAQTLEKQQKLAGHQCSHDDIIRENEELKQKVMMLQQQLTLFMQQVQEGRFSQPQVHPISQSQPQQPQQLQQHLQQNKSFIPQPQQKQQQLSSNIPNATGIPSSNTRQSLLPQCIQPTQTIEFNETSIYGAMSNAPSVVQDLWSGTFACNDRFTLPIDQSEYIRENIPTSTPTHKRAANAANDENKRQSFNRRLSRPSVGGSPHLSPIVETSRECNSKSSSSSSAMSNTTPATGQKNSKVVPLTQAQTGDNRAIVGSAGAANGHPYGIDERPIDPSDTSSYKQLLDNLSEPISRRIGYYRVKKNLPPIKPERTCVKAGADEYLIVKEIPAAEKLYTAIFFDDDSNESTSTNIPAKMFCVKVDQPANEWVFYMCNELQRRLVKRRSKPDIELSIMNANPAIIYNNGSILIDEHTRKATLSQLLEACKTSGKLLPKAVSTFMTLELLQVIKQMHSCSVIHMAIKPENVVINGCPTREDISNVDERTSVIKLVGFDRSMDMKLLEAGTSFECTLDDLFICEMRDGKAWSWQIDWYGALDCIHLMMFGEKMNVWKNPQKNEKWSLVDRSFKGFPSNVWNSLFDELLNIDAAIGQPNIDRSIEELSTWVKANNSYILKQMSALEDFFKELKAQDLNSTSLTNRSSN